MTVDHTTAPAVPAAVELCPGLHVLGASVRLDGRISWAPADVRGWQPINTYVLVDGQDVLVIDPGIYLQRHIVCEQLESIVAAGSVISVFVTRAEPDTTGNLGEITSRFPVRALYAGGGPNPFDAFEAVTLTDRAHRGERIQMERTPPGFTVPVSAARSVEVLRPSIRLLATWWGYDAVTRTLFTSDAFGHSVQANPGDSRVLDDPAAAQDDIPSVRAHLYCKFGWLERARTETIVENVRSMFQDREIERIAPAHGLVIEGAEMVKRHVEALEAILKETT